MFKNSYLKIVVFFAFLASALFFTSASAHKAEAPTSGKAPTYQLYVKKTAVTSYTRTWNWEITKTVTPATWDLFTGDNGTSSYTVSVNKTGYTDSGWTVTGDIYISNATPLAANITSIVDIISPGTQAPVVCPRPLPFTLQPGNSMTCSYTTTVPDGSDTINTVTVYTTGTVGGNVATAEVDFGLPTTEANASINVIDTNGMSWGPVSDNASWTYDRTFACDKDEGTHENVATIVETKQSATASVTVNCYDLKVTKNANTSYDRTWNWDIQKSADQTSIVLMPGQQYLVNYEVTVSATSTEANWAVNGSIWVANSHPSRAAELTSVSDLISPNIPGVVNCPSLVVPAGGMLECTYSAFLPDASSRTNTATATLQNYAYDSNGNGALIGTSDFSGTANVTFGAPTNEVDECIDVTDTLYGFLGTVCADAQPVTYAYSLYVGPYTTCGKYLVENIASFTTNDTGSTGSATWTIDITVPCQGGCSLTPGYWKTHSEYGPAPYDDTWGLLANGADTMFYDTGKTFYEVLWIAPQGNAYYILAKAYIAAYLNGLNGADTTVITQQLSHAAYLLNQYDGNPYPMTLIKNAIRTDFLQTAAILDAYNNGLIGPGHCSE